MAKAKLEVVCKCCGEKFTIERTFSSRKEADSWLEWADGSIDTCKECRKKEEEAKIDMKLSEKGIELSELEGSEKQIAWAEKIRKSVVRDFLNRDVSDKFWNLLNSVTEAKFWIENVRINAVSVEFISIVQESRKKQKQAESANAEIAELVKPVKPDCYPDGYWNKKFYSSRNGGRRIYIDNEETIISEEDAKCIEKYWKELTEYKKAKKEIESKYGIR